MPETPINEAAVAQILSKRKFVYRVKYDNTARSPGNPVSTEPNEKRIVYDLRFLDAPEKEAHLQFLARQETPVSGVYPRPMPGMSLRWKGVRIRGINWNLRHDVVSNGVSTGYIRGWHEKLWTNADADKYIVDINGEVRNRDLNSMIRFAFERWNVEDPKGQTRLGGL